MISEEIENKYIEYKLKGWIDSKDSYKKHVGDLTEKTIIGSFKNKFDISHEDYDKLVERHSDIQKIKQKYTFKREENFGDIREFYKWYKNQNQACGYCAITQNEIDIIVNDRGGNLTLNKGTKRSKGTLEIEKKDSNKGYEKDNIILACPLCNNAKSNLISEDDWRDSFVEAMRSYYEKLLGKKLVNPKP